jgi:thioredoxin reductase (NADPH)
MMQKTDHDIVIIGGGPAGLTAAIYAARAKLDAVVIEKAVPGGQILVTDWIENYPGFPEGLTGADLIQKMTEQVARFGVPVTYDEVLSIEKTPDNVIHVKLSNRILTAKAAVVVTGASPKKLGVPGEDEFYGRGVSACATCDGPFFKNNVVAAVGGGDTAVQEAIFLTRFAQKVYLIHRRDELRAARLLQERVFANEKIEMVWDSVVTAINGSMVGVTGVSIKNVKTGQESELKVDGCFLWVGITPNTAFLKDLVQCNDAGFIVVNSRMETSVPGIYAAGDVRNTPLRQVATAVGDSAIATFEAARYIEGFGSGAVA